MKEAKKEIDKKNPSEVDVAPPQKAKKVIISEEINTEASVHISTKATRKSGLSINIKQLPPKLNQTSLYNALRYFRQKLQ